MSEGVPRIPKDEGRPRGYGEVLYAPGAPLDPEDRVVLGVLDGALQLDAGADVHHLFLRDPTDGGRPDSQTCCGDEDDD